MSTKRAHGGVLSMEAMYRQDLGPAYLGVYLFHITRDTACERSRPTYFTPAIAPALPAQSDGDIL